MSKVIVYGGCGALGKAVTSFFKKNSWSVISIDLFPNTEADHNVVLEPTLSWEDQSNKVLESVGKILGNEKVKSIVCVAGGWAGGGVGSNDVVKNSELMWKQSVHSSLIAAQLANRNLAEGGVLNLTGAAAAASGTPGMVGYGMAKAAVHQLVKSLASNDSGLPKGATVNAVCPITLDTPGNRAAMPNADTSSWTPLDVLSQKYFNWASGKIDFNNGDLLKVVTLDGTTTFSALLEFHI
jgi:dihydropteridine reductase